MLLNYVIQHIKQKRRMNYNGAPSFQVYFLQLNESFTSLKRCATQVSG